jgi:hypothetical protein
MNLESEKYITPGEQMIQKNPMCGDDDDSDHYSLTLDSQHTIKSGLTMETFLRSPTGKSMVKDRFAKHTVTAGMNHKKAGEEKKKRSSSRRPEYQKLDERQDPQRRSGSPTPALQDPRTVRGSCNSEERSRRRRASSVGARENEKEVSSVNDVASISVSDPCRKKERKKQSSSKEVKRSRSTDGSAGSSSKEGRRSQRIRSSSVATTSKQEERESRKHRSKSRSPILIPSNDAYPRIPDLDWNTSSKAETSESSRSMQRAGGLQRTSSDPNLKAKVDAAFNSEKSTLRRLSAQKSRSLVSSLERSSGIGRSSYMPSLSPIHSEASSPVEDIVETIRKQLEAYASSHAPSQTQDAIVRMRWALDAMSSLLVDGSSRTEARTHGVSSSNGYFGQAHNPAHPFGLSPTPTPTQVFQTNSSSGVPPVVVGTTGSCSSSSGTSSRNHESFVRRWLPRQTSERIHRTMSRGRSDTSSNNNNVHIPLQTPERREVRQAQQELDQIQQRLEHDLDRLYHKWDELQQKQKELRRRSPTRL